MNEKLKYRLDICLIHFVLYFIIVMIPWMYAFEMLPVPYNRLPVRLEAALYILWSIVLIFASIQVKKDIVSTSNAEEKTVSRRMWKVIFSIMWILMLVTLAYLILTLILIGISYLI